MPKSVDTYDTYKHLKVESETLKAQVVKALRAVRTCLSCNVKFDSHGPGNRICKRCKERHEDQGL